MDFVKKCKPIDLKGKEKKSVRERERKERKDRKRNAMG